MMNVVGLDLVHADEVALVTTEQYWIIGARDVIRHLIRKGIKCCKVRVSSTNQMMNDFPSSSISAPSFMRCGGDMLVLSKLKSLKVEVPKAFKVCITLFVFFTTRAIHLELVTDLSVDATLKRFISRGGKFSDTYSDFVGTKCKFIQFEKLMKSANYIQIVSKFLINNSIKWPLNVPGAPHMDGLWEVGIKSTKYYLKRVVGETKITYEKFETILTQIEACFNFRPLKPISNAPKYLSALTHFIIGRPLTQPNYTDSNNSYLTRIQKLVDQFCKKLEQGIFMSNTTKAKMAFAN
ncbi:integrase catalytic domain-containing protein [Trichonephila clavipes]|nr:integrase catalytic domain-containing protein [Trichonephila clavipes]